MAKDPNVVRYPNDKPFRITKCEVHYTDETSCYNTWRITPNLKLNQLQKDNWKLRMDAEHEHKTELCKIVEERNKPVIGRTFSSTYECWRELDKFYAEEYNDTFVHTMSGAFNSWVENGFDWGLREGKDYVLLCCSRYGLLHFYWIEEVVE